MSVLDLLLAGRWAGGCGSVGGDLFIGVIDNEAIERCHNNRKKLDHTTEK